MEIDNHDEMHDNSSKYCLMPLSREIYPNNMTEQLLLPGSPIKNNIPTLLKQLERVLNIFYVYVPYLQLFRNIQDIFSYHAWKRLLAQYPIHARQALLFRT